LLYVKNYNYLNLKVHFSKRKVTKLHQMPINYHVWSAMLERHQRCMPKLTNIAELKDCFVDDTE